MLKIQLWPFKQIYPNRNLFLDIEFILIMIQLIKKISF